MADDASQANPEVQAPDPSTPAGRQSIRQAAAAEAVEELKAETPSTEPQAEGDGTDDVKPEAEGSPDGDGGDGSDPSPEGEPAPTTDDIDWTNDEAREAHLQTMRDEREEALANQRRSLTSEIESERQQMQARSGVAAHKSKLEALDALRASDPEAWEEQVTSDGDAQAALVWRTAQTNAPDESQRAALANDILMSQQATVYQMRPELEKLSREDPDKWSAAVDPKTGGFWGYVDRTGRELGAAGAVKAYQDSTEYQTAISEAELRGRQAVMAELGMSETPPADGAVAPGAAKVALPDDPRQAAFAEAKAELEAGGKKVGIGVDQISRSRKQPVRS